MRSGKAQPALTGADRPRPHHLLAIKSDHAHLLQTLKCPSTFFQFLRPEWTGCSMWSLTQYLMTGLRILRSNLVSPNAILHVVSMWHSSTITPGYSPDTPDC